MNIAHYVLAGLIFSVVVGCDSGTTLDKNNTGMEGAEAPSIHPEIWPKQDSPIKRNKGEEQRIAALVAQMSLEEKVGQVIQADIGSVTPDQVRDYHLGSVLNGGNSAPGGDNRTTPAAWVALADEFWLASTDKTDGRTAIPALWGTDAVHGHINSGGATLFPHYIGFGAANDPNLMH
jgi:beta-glucosidase